MRPVEDVDVGERVALVVQLEDFATDELGLLGSVPDREHGGLRPTRADGYQLPFEAFDLGPMAENLVGEGEDFGVDR